MIMVGVLHSSWPVWLQRMAVATESRATMSRTEVSNAYSVLDSQLTNMLTCRIGSVGFSARHDSGMLGVLLGWKYSQPAELKNAASKSAPK